jgi:propanediol dehydratase small subunit
MSEPEAPASRDVYPLGQTAPASLRAHSGRALGDLTLAHVRDGLLGPDDFAIHAETLRRQARLAAEHGYPELAANLRRAAELTAVPDDELLAIYEALRPGRATSAELGDLAARLETAYGAKDTAAFVREAAEAYRDTGLAPAAEG